MQQPFGFTLIETLIYSALFSAMFVGIFMSTYPLFTGAERLTAIALREGEILFLQSKIQSTIQDTITSSTGVIISPAAGSSAHELILGTAAAEYYIFREDLSYAACSPPRHCSFLSLQAANQPALPLNNERIVIDDFTVDHIPPNLHTGAPRHLDISFTADGETVGPIRYYLHF